MADYQESNVSGTMWRRAHKIIINNGYEKTKGIIFRESDAVLLGDKYIETPAGSVYASLTPETATEQIPLRDPETGADLGQTFTPMQLYAMLYSLYLHQAEERDAALEEAEE